MRLTSTACMRRVFLLIVPLFLCTILFANDSQDGEKITLFEKATPLKTVFKKITSQTGIKFVYSNRLVDDEQKVDVSVRNASLEEVLQQVFYGRKFEVQRTGAKSVVLIVHEKSVSAAPAVTTNDVAIIDVTGTVSDDKGEKLPGATVQVRGVNKATMTDDEGRFRLDGVLANARLLVSFTGYGAEEIKLTGQRVLDVKLRIGENRLDEAVIVAYGTSTLRSNVGAMSVVKGEQIQTLPNRSFDKSLQGLVPGLLITNGTGQPGGGVSSFVLRGISTGTDALNGSTVRNPLIIIDGIPVTQDHFQRNPSANATVATNPMAQINPADIKDISVLKDAAAIALYGSKASNGVILVTTKRGAQGKTAISFRHQTDLNTQPTISEKTLNKEQYLELLYETYRNTNAALWTDATIKTDLISKFPYSVSGGDTSFYPAPDWENLLYADPAITVSNNLSFSGGLAKGNYYLNLEYTDQGGLVKSTGFKRTSVRLNVDNRPTQWLKLGVGAFFSYDQQRIVTTDFGPSAVGARAQLSPLNAVRDQQGAYILNYKYGLLNNSPDAIQNPAAAIELNSNRNAAYRGMLNLNGELSFLKYFSFTSSLGIDFMLAESKAKIDPRFKDREFSTSGSIDDRSVRRAHIISNNILRFRKLFGSYHSIDVLLGQEAQIRTDKSTGITVTGDSTTLPYYTDVNSPGYTLDSYQSSLSRQNMLSQFAQLTYEFNRKYLLSGSFRRDGSSLFSSNNKFGNYWSAGAGWIISSESFMEALKKQVNYLKLRGSLGIAGNSAAVGNNIQYSIITLSSFLRNTAFVPASTPGNPDIKWERTFSWDLGLEASLFNDRVSFTADIYSKKTHDLIYQVSLPSYSGYAQVMDNVGDINNKGIELAIQSVIIRKKDFSWKLNANWSRNQNKLVKANGNLQQQVTGFYSNKVGEEFNSMFVAVWAGVNPENGNATWRDSSGKATENYLLAKKEFVGKVQPDAFGSITNIVNWKGIELNVQLYYQYGNVIYDFESEMLINDGYYPYANQRVSALNRWQKPGDIAENPGRKLMKGRANAYSTRFVRKGDYIRLQNVLLSYQLPARWLSPTGLSLVRLFMQGNNLAIWTPNAADPDNASVVGNMNFQYPISKSFSAGLNVQF